MDAIECIKGRRSIRKFKEDKLDRQLIKDIVEISSYAPSWKNTQTPRYVYIDSKELMNDIADKCVLDFEYNKKTINGAAGLVIVTTVPNRCGYERDGSYTTSKKDSWEMFDAGIASQTFCLAAYEKGLGTVIMGIFDEEETKKVLELESGYKVSAMIAIGYPAINPDTPPRKNVDELVKFI